MKITFIYAYENELWSTPKSLTTEFSSRGWVVDIVSIGSNSTGYYHDRDLRNWVESKPKTDIVLFMDWGRFDSPYLDKSLVDAFWIQESGDDPQNFERNFPKANKFHLTITPDYRSCLAYRAAGVNCEWITHFADNKIYKPYNIAVKYLGVCTRGRGASEFMDTIVDHSEGQVINMNGFLGEEHGKFLRSGLIVLQNSRFQEITRRIFEGACCGRLVLTDRLPEHTRLEELLVDSQDIVYYNDINDCIEKLNYYAENHEERERIALNGYNKVINNFTQVQVVDRLIENFNKHKQ